VSDDLSLSGLSILIRQTELINMCESTFLARVNKFGVQIISGVESLIPTGFYKFMILNSFTLYSESDEIPF
jgi:hypothetical protein